MSTPHRQSKKHVKRQEHSETTIRWWQRPIIWIAGLVSALILATVTAFGTGLGNTLLAKVTTHPHPAGPLGPPVAIESISFLQPWEDYSYVLPGKLVLTSAQLVSVNSGLGSSMSAYSSWFENHGGIIANRGIIGITVRGNDTGPVTITDMQVVKHCTTPLVGGTLFYSPTQGAGPFGTDQIGFDLSQQVTIGQYIPAPGAHMLPAGGNFFAKKVITLNPGEPQTLSAFVSAENEYCSFSFKMNVASPNHGPSVVNITNNGRPFQITTDGEPSLSGTLTSTVPFSSYRVVYAGGFADVQNQEAFVRVNPATYHGSGNPEGFPLSSPSGS